MSLKVLKIVNKSPAKIAGIKKNDIIHRIDGIEMNDFIDDIYVNSLVDPVVEVERNNKFFIKRLNKSDNENIGIYYREYLFTAEKSCTNKCLFCFVDQLPKNMRNSLYVKDDDWRYSVLYGNYITMTNMNNDDFFRIASRKVSPLYISVHATDPDVRIKLLGNKKGGDIMERLNFLYKKKITFHSQIVLCPDINDGDILSQSIIDLSKLYPYAKTLSVVPVGLTEHRENLPKLKMVDSLYAKKTIDIINHFRDKLSSDIGVPFVYASDEFYAKARIEYPMYNSDEIVEQKANGVGLFSDFIQEFDLAIQELDEYNCKGRQVSVITGDSAYEKINEMCAKLKNHVRNLKIDVIKVENKFFGDSITVSGLLSGRDIISAIKDNNSKIVFIPENALKNNELIFLDNISIKDIERETNSCVIIAPNDGYSFAVSLTGRTQT